MFSAIQPSILIAGRMKRRFSHQLTNSITSQAHQQQYASVMHYEILLHALLIDVQRIHARMQLTNGLQLKVLIEIRAAQHRSGASRRMPCKFTTHDADPPSLVSHFTLLFASVAKSGVGISSMGVMNHEAVMKNIIPVVMAGVLGIYGLIIAVILVQNGQLQNRSNAVV